MGFHLVLVVIQKTENAEPGDPVQHFFLTLIKISDSKTAGGIGCVQCKKAEKKFLIVIFFVIILILIIKQVHILEVVIKF